MRQIGQGGTAQPVIQPAAIDRVVIQRAFRRDGQITDAAINERRINGTMQAGADQHMLMIACHIVYSILPHECRRFKSAANGNVVPCIDVQCGSGKAILRGEVAKIAPVGRVFEMAQEILVIGRIITVARNQSAGGQVGDDLRRVHACLLHLRACFTARRRKPAIGGGKVRYTALEQAEIAARCAAGADRAACALGNHGAQMRIARLGLHQLHLAQGRATGSGNTAIRPFLRRDPIHRCCAISGHMRVGREHPFRAIAPAQILHDDGITRRAKGAHPPQRTLKIILAIGQTDQERRHRGVCLFGQVDVSSKMHAIRHRNHHIALPIHPGGKNLRLERAALPERAQPVALTDRKQRHDAQQAGQKDEARASHRAADAGQ